MYKIIDLRKGEVIREGEDLEELLTDLPEGFYEVKKNGQFIKFHSVVNEDNRSWI